MNDLLIKFTYNNKNPYPDKITTYKVIETVGEILKIYYKNYVTALH